MYFVIMRNKKQFDRFVIENLLQEWVQSKELKYLPISNVKESILGVREFYYYTPEYLPSFILEEIGFWGGLELDKETFLNKLRTLSFVLKKDDMYFAIAEIHSSNRVQTRGFWINAGDFCQVYHMRTNEEAQKIANLFKLKDYIITKEEAENEK